MNPRGKQANSSYLKNPQWEKATSQWLPDVNDRISGAEWDRKIDAWERWGKDLDAFGKSLEAELLHGSSESVVIREDLGWACRERG